MPSRCCNCAGSWRGGRNRRWLAAERRTWDGRSRGPAQRKWDGRPRLSGVLAAEGGSFAGQPRRRLRWAAEDGYPTGARGGESGMGVLACPVFWQPRAAASPGSRGRRLRWAAETATLLLPLARRKWDGRPRLSAFPTRAAIPLLGSRHGYPTAAASAEKVGWASSPVGFGRAGLAAGTAASLGSRDGYPTAAVGAEKVGWASSPVGFGRAGLAAETAASPGSRDGYPTFLRGGAD